MYRQLAVGLIALVAFAAANQKQSGETVAIAVLFGMVRGNVTFRQMSEDAPVIISGIVEGLTPGPHGFHIHEKGDISMGCASTLGHYNPYKKQHGAPTDDNRHVGDLGNIVADARGICSFEIQDHLVKLSGPHSVMGRAVVVHSDADDLGKGGHPDSLTTGHAGSRVGCGVIGVKELGANKSWMLSSSIISILASLLIAIRH